MKTRKGIEVAEWFEERAAIIEHCGDGVDRNEAEAIALLETCQRYGNGWREVLIKQFQLKVKR